MKTMAVRSLALLVVVLVALGSSLAGVPSRVSQVSADFTQSVPNSPIGGNQMVARVTGVDLATCTDQSVEGAFFRNCNGVIAQTATVITYSVDVTASAYPGGVAPVGYEPYADFYTLLSVKNSDMTSNSTPGITAQVPAGSTQTFTETLQLTGDFAYGGSFSARCACIPTTGINFVINFSRASGPGATTSNNPNATGPSLSCAGALGFEQASASFYSTLAQAPALTLTFTSNSAPWGIVGVQVVSQVSTLDPADKSNAVDGTPVFGAFVATPDEWTPSSDAAITPETPIINGLWGAQGYPMSLQLPFTSVHGELLASITHPFVVTFQVAGTLYPYDPSVDFLPNRTQVAQATCTVQVKGTYILHVLQQGAATGQGKAPDGQVRRTLLGSQDLTAVPPFQPQYGFGNQTVILPVGAVIELRFIDGTAGMVTLPAPADIFYLTERYNFTASYFTDNGTRIAINADLDGALGKYGPAGGRSAVKFGLKRVLTGLATQIESAAYLIAIARGTEGTAGVPPVYLRLKSVVGVTVWGDAATVTTFDGSPEAVQPDGTGLVIQPGTTSTQQADGTYTLPVSTNVTDIQTWISAGTPGSVASAAAAAVLFDNWNTGGVSNGPTAPTAFTLSQPAQITAVNSYHWNNGNGTSVPGTLALSGADGSTYGPWQATGSLGSGGVLNAVWTANPDVTIPAGTYTVVDSDPTTWSQDSQSGGAGFSQVKGAISSPVTGASPSAGTGTSTTTTTSATSTRSAPLLHVGPNPSNCTGPFSGSSSGSVSVVPNATQTSANLSITVGGALPNTTYVVDVRCVAQISTLTTNGQGSGSTGMTLFASSLPAGPFYIDLSVPNGGGGNGNYGDTFVAGPFTVK